MQITILLQACFATPSDSIRMAVHSTPFNHNREKNECSLSRREGKGSTFIEKKQAIFFYFKWIYVSTTINPPFLLIGQKKSKNLEKNKKIGVCYKKIKII
jgi:hypothetical protein